MQRILNGTLNLREIPDLNHVNQKNNNVALRRREAPVSFKLPNVHTTSPRYQCHIALFCCYKETKIHILFRNQAPTSQTSSPHTCRSGSLSYPPSFSEKNIIFFTFSMVLCFYLTKYLNVITANLLR